MYHDAHHCVLQLSVIYVQGPFLAKFIKITYWYDTINAIFPYV